MQGVVARGVAACTCDGYGVVACGVEDDRTAGEGGAIGGGNVAYKGVGACKSV